MVTGFSSVESRSVLGRLRDAASSASRLETTAWRLLCLFALSIPFSIALAQVMLTLTIAVAILRAWLGGQPPPRTALDWPVLCFVATTFLAAFLGLDVWQSLWGIRTYLQILIVYLVVLYARTPQRLLELASFFLVGMVITSSHTVFNVLSPWKLPEIFPGEMTKSGQLLFTIGLSVSLVLYRALWPRLMPVTVVLHAVALIADMKRGVWLGALALITVLGLVRSRRVIFAAATLLALTILLAPSVRARIDNTTRDLFLPGNRYDIWKAAVDVVHRFPMGVGRKNGTILRDYPNIPKNHKHAHNDLLQITLEDGYLGLAAYLWWMGGFGWISWRTWHRSTSGDPVGAALSLAVFSSFVGIQVAGLVEYNFGNTEILEIFFVMMGIGLQLDKLGRTPVRSVTLSSTKMDRG